MEGKTGEYGDLEAWNAVTAKGEPYKFGIPCENEAAITDWLARRGYQFVDGDFAANYYDANRIEREFLRGKRRSKASSRILRVETTCDVVQM